MSFMALPNVLSLIILKFNNYFVPNIELILYFKINIPRKSSIYIYLSFIIRKIIVKSRIGSRGERSIMIMVWKHFLNRCVLKPLFDT